MYDYDNHRLMLFYLRADRDTIVEVMITRCDASELMSRAYPIRAWQPQGSQRGLRVLNVTRMASFTETIKRTRICPTGSLYLFQYPSHSITSYDDTDVNGDHGHDDARSR